MVDRHFHGLTGAAQHAARVARVGNLQVVFVQQRDVGRAARVGLALAREILALLAVFELAQLLLALGGRNALVHAQEHVAQRGLELVGLEVLII